MLDSGLEAVESAITRNIGSDMIFSHVKKIHIMANNLRFEGSKRAGSDKSKQIEDASVMGAVMEVSGLASLMRVFSPNITG